MSIIIVNGYLDDRYGNNATFIALITKGNVTNIE